MSRRAGLTRVAVVKRHQIQLESGTSRASPNGNWNLPDAGANGYVVGTSQQNYTVAQGSHTVQTQVYVTTATPLGNWQTTSHLANGQ